MSKTHKDSEPTRRNIVAKHMRKYNMHRVQADRKLRAKRGYRKHKKAYKKAYKEE